MGIYNNARVRSTGPELAEVKDTLDDNVQIIKATKAYVKKKKKKSNIKQISILWGAFKLEW